MPEIFSVNKYIDGRQSDNWIKKWQELVVYKCMTDTGRSRNRMTWLECIRQDVKKFGLRVDDPKTDRTWCDEVNFVVKCLCRVSMNE